MFVVMCGVIDVGSLRDSVVVMCGVMFHGIFYVMCCVHVCYG